MIPQPNAVRRFRRAVGSEGASKLAFAMLLIVAALMSTYTGADGDFPPGELFRVLVHMMAVSGILLVGALVLPWRRGVSDAALASVTLAGVFTSYVVHTELFHPANRAWLILVLAASWFALFTAFRAIENLRYAGIVLTVAAALAVVAPWGPKLLAGMREPGGLLYFGSPAMWTVLVLAGAGVALMLYLLSRHGVRPSRSGGLALLVSALFLATLILAVRFRFGDVESGYYSQGLEYSQGWEDHPNVRSVTFKETPNLYFVGFDSITPEAVMGRHMGIWTTEFHRLMESEMRRFRNLFANAVRTKHSINTILALDQDIYQEYGKGRRPSYFAGHDLSPLIWLLGQNGYETTSIYDNTYFGHTKGPHIDNYQVRDKDSTLCRLLDEGIRPLAFGGYCWNRAPELLSLSASAFLVQRLSGVDRTKPQFVLAHLYLPGHTPTNFDYENPEDRERFVAAFRERFDRAAIPLRQIIEHLAANDPDSILFVFGDHGPLLSRGFAVEDNPAFVLRDRFGILGGVHPRNRCAPELDGAERKGYVTSLDVVHALILCLSDGQSPLLEPRRDRFWSDGLPEEHSYDYQEFRYE